MHTSVYHPILLHMCIYSNLIQGRYIGQPSSNKQLLAYYNCGMQMLGRIHLYSILYYSIVQLLVYTQCKVWTLTKLFQTNNLLVDCNHGRAQLGRFKNGHGHTLKSIRTKLQPVRTKIAIHEDQIAIH